MRHLWCWNITVRCIIHVKFMKNLIMDFWDIVKGREGVCFFPEFHQEGKKKSMLPWKLWVHQMVDVMFILPTMSPWCRRGRGGGRWYQSRKWCQAGALHLRRPPGVSGAELYARTNQCDRSHQEAAGRRRTGSCELGLPCPTLSPGNYDCLLAKANTFCCPE